MAVSKRLLIVFAASTLFAPILMAPTAAAQDSEDSLQNLLACDKIKNASEKLECFNAIVEILKQDTVAH